MTARVYFAGVNQNSFCEAFKGFHVLESFAEVRPVMDRYRPTFASMILDSGAFTVMTTGKVVDLGEYADFCVEHGRAYEWLANLDAIDGGVAKNVANFEALTARGLDVVPTFHQGEPWSALADYCATKKRIGLGFQRVGPKHQIIKPREWLEECFSRIPTGHPVHGWAMTAYTDFPFESVDSTTWLWEVKALMGVSGQGAEAMRCLTQSELIEIVQRKYERLPKRNRWGMKASAQASLFTAENE